MEVSMIGIEQKIHVLRGQKVMLDTTLADFYEVENSALKRAVRRNITRFPSDFMFEITENEMQNLVNQFGVLEPKKEKSHGGNRFFPFAFTESGVGMLSSVLKSERAIQINISIMRTFIQLRKISETRTSLLDRVIRIEERTNEIGNKIMQIERQTQMSSKAELRQLEHSHLQKETTEKRLTPSFETIEKAVAKHYGLKTHDLKKMTRTRAIGLPRQIAIYLIRKRTNASFREIGIYFGGKDHTTILHACRKIENLINRDRATYDIVAAIQNLLIC